LYRLNLIHFRHSIDQIAALPDLPLKQREKSQSYAFEAVAKAQGTEKDTITKAYNISSVYFVYAEKGGPGALLLIDGAKTE
jgi:hypothetical protein